MAPAKEATDAPKVAEEPDGKARPDPDAKKNGEKPKEEAKGGSPSFKETPLFKALAGPLSFNTLAVVQDLLDKGEDVNATGSFQESYLHVLMAPRDEQDVVVTDKPPEDKQEGQSETTDQSNQPEDQKDQGDQEGLAMIKEERRSRVIASLIYQLAAAGIKMTRRDQEGNTALHIAALNDQPPMVAAALIQAGLDPCLINASEEDATDLVEIQSTRKALRFFDPGLWRAANENKVKKTISLLEAWCKIDIYDEDDEEETLLTTVDDKEYYDIVVALKSHMKTNKLIHAALAGKHDEVKSLVLEGGIDVNAINKGHFNMDGSQQDMPLLGELVLLGRHDSAKLLVKKGADVNVMVKAGNNNEEPLFYYLLQRCFPLAVDVFKIIMRKADFSLIKEKHFAILQSAWQWKLDSELLGVMVSRGLPIGIRGDEGYNLRDLIVQETCNAEDEERKQALYFVDEHLLDMAMEGRLEDLKDLAHAGYSYILITNRKGKPINKFAEKENQTKVVKFLEALPKYGKTGYKVYNAILKGNLAEVRDTMDAALADCCDCLGRSPLQLAVLYERRYILKWLLKRYPDSINATDQYDRAPLHYAYMIPDGEDIVQQLLEAKADEQLRDRMGKLPSDYKNQTDKRMLESERLRPCGINTLTLDRYLVLRDGIKAGDSERAIEVIDRIAEFHPRGLMDLPSQFPQLVYEDLLFLCEKHKQDDTAITLIKAGVPYNHTTQITKEDGTTEVMTVREAADHYKCVKLAKFLDEYKPEPADYESRNGHLALAAAMALAEGNSVFSPRGISPESDISLPESPRPDTSEQPRAPGAPPAPEAPVGKNPDVKNSSSCVIL